MGDEQVVQDVQHDVKIKDNINFTKKWLSGGKYEYSRIFNDEYGGQSFNLSAGSTTKATFELPATVMNHYRSRLRFDLNIATSTTAFAQWVYMGTFPIHQVVLQTLSGTRIASLDNVELMVRALAPYLLKEEEYARLPLMSAVNAGAVDNLTYSGVGVMPAGTNGAFASNTFTDRRLVAGASGDPDIPLREGVEAVSGTASAGGPPTVGGELSLSYDIPLRLFFESVFSVDQDSFYNEAVQLVVYFSDKAKMIWKATTGANPAGGATANDSDVSLSNVILLNAIETQEDIVRAIKNKAETEGFQKIIPWCESWKRQITGTKDNDTTNIFPQFGGNLLRIYSMLTGTAELENTNYDLNNINTGVQNAKIEVFQSSLDNRPLQQQLLNCPRDDYAFLADKLIGSNILSNNHYQYKHVWIDDFTGLRTSEFLENGAVVSGTKLEKKMIHNILYDTILAGNWYSYKYGVFQRRLITTSEGVVVLNSLE